MAKFTQTLCITPNKIEGSSLGSLLNSQYCGKIHIGPEDAGYTMFYTYSCSSSRFGVESVEYDVDLDKRWDCFDETKREFFVPNIVLKLENGISVVPKEIVLSTDCLKTAGNDVDVIWASTQPAVVAHNFVCTMIGGEQGIADIILPENMALYNVSKWVGVGAIAEKGLKTYHRHDGEVSALEQVDELRNPDSAKYINKYMISRSPVKVDETRMFDRKTGEVKAKPSADTTRVR